MDGNGFIVHTFEDPVLALQNFRKDSYDLLILDVKMKQMSGLELYEEIKKIDNNVKVCFLTAGQFNYGQFIDTFNNLKEIPFDHKPVPNNELIRIINDIISKSHTILYKLKSTKTLNPTAFPGHTYTLLSNIKNSKLVLYTF